MLDESSGVTEEQLNEVALTVSKHLPGRCKFCPRSFETGEQIIFGTLKQIQMAWLEADVETATPAGTGEQHVIDIINAHLPCAITNRAKFRGVSIPRKII